LNYAITKQKEAFEKLNGLLKNLKDHDSTLFQPNDITLKHGEKFHHDFNVKHIASVDRDEAVKGFTGNRNSRRKEEDL